MTAVLLISAAAARATAIDPVIIISPDGPAPTPVVNSTFNFQSNSNGGGVFFFINETGLPWSALDFFATLPSGSTFDCAAPNLYTDCGAGPVASIAFATAVTGSVQYDIGFDGPSPGILPKEDFTINLNNFSEEGVNPDPNGSGGWGPNNQINAVVTFDTVPEPSSFLLLAGGAAVLACFRRRRNSADC